MCWKTLLPGVPLGFTGTRCLQSSGLPPSPFPASLFSLLWNCWPLGSVLQNFVGELLFCPYTPSPSAQTLFKSGSHYITRAGLELAMYVAQNNIRLSIQLLQLPQSGDGLQMCATTPGSRHHFWCSACDAPAPSRRHHVTSPECFLPPSSPHFCFSITFLCFGKWHTGYGVIQVSFFIPWLQASPSSSFLSVSFSASAHLLFYVRLHAQAQSLAAVLTGITASPFLFSTIAFLCLKHKEQTSVHRLCWIMCLIASTMAIILLLTPFKSTMLLHCKKLD